ncbi:MAG: Undecaprenyl phosphate-alpha-4-amino-4-deoxy-L-arabinose arabinosyl transferase, partial [Planctomycetota bacterium]
IARTMLETGDWIVPRFNDELAVDKPVLMHWAMAASAAIFGTSEVAARLPAALATLLTALALLRAGTRWFGVSTGMVSALAYVGCLLVGIEAHAATPDAILTCLTTWATVLFAEPLVAAVGPTRIGWRRAAVIGGLLGLAVLCKGPIGVVGPLAVVLPWTLWLAWDGSLRPAAVVRATLTAVSSARLGVILSAMLAVAAPWYTAVSLRTDGEWIEGFFFIHNVGRFVAPMERHGGSVLLHPLALLVGFFPWSCFLPLALVVSAWRIARRADPPAERAALALALVWLAVWVGGFSASATKLPNYVLPAYPAAALIVAAAGVAAATRGRWAHPRWMAAGTASLAIGGVITAAVVVAATRFGLTGAEPAAAVGLVPIVGAIAIWLSRRDPMRAVWALCATGLVFTSLAVGPAAARIAAANALPGLVDEAHRHAGGRARLGTFTQITPNVVYYARGHVTAWQEHERDDCLRFLASGPDAVVLVRADNLPELEAALPEGVGIIGRSRPLFHEHDFVLVGSHATDAPTSARQAAARHTSPEISIR